MATVVKFRLQIHSHSQTRSGISEKPQEVEDLWLNPKDHPDLKDGDIVEIYYPEDEYSRLLLQVKSKSFKEDCGHNVISLEESVARTFHLRAYHDVIINKVSFNNVALDLLELTVKDQYFSRSDMWNYSNALTGSCAYLHKKLDHGCGKAIVHEMWATGIRVACGTIGPNTRIVYRSMTANVYIFIQLSVEMWEFDFYGDLYFEKSVKGFLTDLFERWTTQGANHDVTIILFSRTFYEAETAEDFPCAMREGLLRDYKGRFYEDFYRIVVQNEKYEDWTFALIKLKTLFHQYTEDVLNFHARPGVKLPRAYNSTASEGNVLEVLNMGLNVFEKHTVDRNFERTGQMCVVITPSTGVFEVDRELLTLTKQKSIDYGIGNDLVFMGQQPLHVVPLFILHNKRSWNRPGDEPEDYAIPNWLNYSYYTSKAANPHVFVPRIRIPEKMLAAMQKGIKDYSFLTGGQTKGKDDGMNRWGHTRTKPMSMKKSRNQPATERRMSESSAVVVIFEEPSQETALPADKLEEQNHLLLSASLETANPLRPNGSGRSFDSLNLDTSVDRKRKITKSPVSRTTRPLINPLAPSKIPVKLGSNRRRWVHIFPMVGGAAVQTHHDPRTSHSEDVQQLSKSPVSETVRDTESPHLPIKPRKLEDTERLYSYVGSVERDDISVVDEDFGPVDQTKSPRRMRIGLRSSSNEMGRGSPAPSGSQGWMEPKKAKDPKKSYVWGITGEMEWTPNLTTGVDWKALTFPASLPITTDYLPDTRTLQNDYLVTIYSVLPEEQPGDTAPNRSTRSEGHEGNRYYSRPLGLRELFDELICQRLQQGFQLIIPRKDGSRDGVEVGKLVRKTQLGSRHPEECFLSLGRVIHKLIMDQCSITVTRYTPRHPYRIPCVTYKYRFMVPDMTRYEVSWVQFSHERLEDFNWNYVDFCVLTKGRGEFKLEHPMKYWKGQYFLLPCSAAAVKKISDDPEESSRCDIFTERSNEDCDMLCEGFMRCMEMCNRMRRPAKNRRAGNSSTKRTPPMPNKPLHRGMHPAAMSTPDLQATASHPSTPKMDHPIHSYSSLEVFKAASGLGIDIVPAETYGSPVRSGLNILSPLHDILDYMRLPAENVVISTKHADLQAGFFISYEAVEWAMDSLGIQCTEMAVELFNRMIVERLIVHASGDPSHPFVCGFYLYNIVSTDGKHAVATELNSSDVDFSQVWIECAVINPAKGWPRFRHAELKKECLPEFLKPEPKFENIEFAYNKTDYYVLNKKKACVIDVDTNHQSQRLEWAIANYHATFTPNCAFEIELKWLQASGPMFGCLIQNWNRKCPYNGFHLVPVPSDPFALPSKANSDPLRMPIFIKLSYDSLLEPGKSTLFEDFPKESRYMRIVLFQEAILRRFGFMQLQENSKRTNVDQHSREYVHVTGGMFVMIPARVSNSELEAIKKVISSHEEADCGVPNSPGEVGFWWAWNSGLTKKWRSLNTGEEAFLDKMLADFRLFCSNSENRLHEFWDCSRNKNS